jgi:2-desacetyl-2-hydroxyethyl bacteriochlorophyllide A dehydrogenase
MRAFVITGPHQASVQEVTAPEPGPGEVVVHVLRAGVCGTDVEFFAGTMPYLHDGQAVYPIRIGHEWCGRVSVLGEGVDPSWAGAFVTGDTMLGCGRCDRCRAGRHHVCADRFEVGVKGGWDGALAERLRLPVRALHRLPEDLPVEAGAMVEPAGVAVRAVEAASGGPGGPVCIWGAGTLGSLALRFLSEEGAEVDVVDPRPEARALAVDLGARRALDPEEASVGGYGAVIDTSTGADVPARAVEQVEPAGRVVLVGLAPAVSSLDTRRVVLRDVQMIGLLAASAGLDGAIARLARGLVPVERLVAATVGLGDVAAVLAGSIPSATGAPKTLVDPSR